VIEVSLIPSEKDLAYPEIFLISVEQGKALLDQTLSKI
jgi:hypothetical protein